MGSVILVEGRSDEAAVRALAARQGRDLVDERIDIVVCGGAGGFRRELARWEGTMVVGLCDAGEEDDVRRAGVTELVVCRADLEEELVRALGVDEVIEVIRAQGELRPFRSFQEQPAQRGRPLDAQLHRFLGTKSGRKVRYGRLLVEALPHASVPDPLTQVLARIEPRPADPPRSRGSGDRKVVG